MMDETLSDLYQELILDHNRTPRNWGELAAPTHRALGHNPLCGDRLTLQLVLSVDGRISEVAFTGQGCAISKASASLMTTALRGLSRDDAERLFAAFHALVTQGHAGEVALGKLVAFQGVRGFPMRVKCATLAWHTLQAALSGQGQEVTTE